MPITIHLPVRKRLHNIIKKYVLNGLYAYAIFGFYALTISPFITNYLADGDKNLFVGIFRVYYAGSGVLRA